MKRVWSCWAVTALVVHLDNTSEWLDLNVWAHDKAYARKCVYSYRTEKKLDRTGDILRAWSYKEDARINWPTAMQDPEVYVMPEIRAWWNKKKKSPRFEQISMFDN